MQPVKLHTHSSVLATNSFNLESRLTNFLSFRFIDHETVSLQSTVSLGRVGRVLGGEMKLASRSGSRENISRAPTPEVKSSTPQAETPPAPAILVSEPDVVASAKASIQIDPQSVPAETESPRNEPVPTPSEPVAPPRRKRKPKGPAPLPSTDSDVLSPVVASTEVTVPVPVPVPAPVPVPVAPSVTTVTAGTSGAATVPAFPDGPDPGEKTLVTLSKDLEFSLDLTSATKGSYVIKPQDEESTRAERRNSAGEVFGMTSSAHVTDPSKSADRVSTDPGCEDDGTIHTLNMIVRTRTDSGRPLSDLVIKFLGNVLFVSDLLDMIILSQEILEQVTVRNLDTGEQIPLSIAEDKLPQCLNPLSLHIMRLTSEYVR